MTAGTREWVGMQVGGQLAKPDLHSYMAFPSGHSHTDDSKTGPLKRHSNSILHRLEAKLCNLCCTIPGHFLDGLFHCSIESWMRTFLLYPPHCYCCHHYSASMWDLVWRPPLSRKRASAVWSPAPEVSQHRTLLAIFGRPFSILYFCCFARSCSPLSEVRTVFDRSRFARPLDGRLLHSMPRRLHSWTRYSLVCCLSLPSCKLPPA